jgi:hypothetical protein
MEIDAEREQFPSAMFETMTFVSSMGHLGLLV